MCKQTEQRWILFHIALLFISFVLIIDFKLSNNLDIQLHDTFIVIHSFPLLTFKDECDTHSDNGSDISVYQPPFIE